MLLSKGTDFMGTLTGKSVSGCPATHQLLNQTPITQREGKLYSVQKAHVYSLGTPVPPTSPDSSSNWEDLTRKYRVAEEVAHCFGIPRHHAWDIPEVSDSPWECQDSSMTVLGAHPRHSHPPGHIKSFSLKVPGGGRLYCQTTSSVH